MQISFIIRPNGEKKLNLSKKNSLTSNYLRGVISALNRGKHIFNNITFILIKQKPLSNKSFFALHHFDLI